MVVLSRFSTAHLPVHGQQKSTLGSSIDRFQRATTQQGRWTRTVTLVTLRAPFAHYHGWLSTRPPLQVCNPYLNASLELLMSLANLVNHQIR